MGNTLTEGLRALVSIYDWKVRADADLFMAAADIIDEQHKAACEKAYGDGASSVPIAVDESQWMRLPKDADGEPIHVGDVMEWVPYDNTYPSVVREVDAVGNGVFFAWDKANGRFAQYEAYAYRHYKQPTVEDVLRDMLDAWGELPSDATNEAIVAEYAAKLQLKEES